MSTGVGGWGWGRGATSGSEPCAQEKGPPSSTETAAVLARRRLLELKAFFREESDPTPHLHCVGRNRRQCLKQDLSILRTELQRARRCVLDSRELGTAHSNS